ncbi:MAG: DUF6033 family protein [Lachnoclostridium sp.]|jgi:hypothetical protein|nr:DUF6033 family protein [Lachnoclostridium sp.]
MAVTGVTNNYSAYTNYMQDTKRTSERDKTEKSGEVSDSKEVSKDTTADYYNYLLDTYSILKSGDVNISSSYLQECVDNPKAAKQLEDSLKNLPDIIQEDYEKAKASAHALGDHLTYYKQSVNINSDGSMSYNAVGISESGPDAADKEKKLEEERKKAKEKSEKEHIEEKKEEEKRIERKKQEEVLLEKSEGASLSDSNIRDLSTEFVQVSSEFEAITVLQNSIPKDMYHNPIDIVG